MNQFTDDNNHYPLTHYVFMNELKINLLDFRKQMDYRSNRIGQNFRKSRRETNTFCVSINSTSNSISIFNDPMLSVFLYSEVDKNRYQMLKAHFERDKKI